jgi:cobalt-zinc-cadmium efflux system membrane fusion protein
MREFTRVEVKKGASQLGYVEVTPVQKIAEGAKIVVNGAYYLQSHLQKSESGGEHSH